jgi:hypothetical protein
MRTTLQHTLKREKSPGSTTYWIPSSASLAITNSSRAFALILQFPSQSTFRSSSHGTFLTQESRNKVKILWWLWWAKALPNPRTHSWPNLFGTLLILGRLRDLWWWANSIHRGEWIVSSWRNLAVVGTWNSQEISSIARRRMAHSVQILSMKILNLQVLWDFSITQCKD